MVMNNTIVVKDLLGGIIALSMDKGNILYTRLFELMKNNELITLDFQDMKVASPFLNASIGSLFKDFSVDDINQRITFINMSAAAEGTLQAVKRNAERYFSNPQEAEFIDKIIENVIKEV